MPFWGFLRTKTSQHIPTLITASCVECVWSAGYYSCCVIGEHPFMSLWLVDLVYLVLLLACQMKRIVGNLFYNSVLCWVYLNCKVLQLLCHWRASVYESVTGRFSLLGIITRMPDETYRGQFVLSLFSCYTCDIKPVLYVDSFRMSNFSWTCWCAGHC